MPSKFWSGMARGDFAKCFYHLCACFGKNDHNEILKLFASVITDVEWIVLQGDFLRKSLKDCQIKTNYIYIVFIVQTYGWSSLRLYHLTASL